MNADVANFNPDSFLDQETDQASTRRPPLPVGEYTGIITDLSQRAWTSRDQTKSGWAFDVQIEVQTGGAAGQPPTLRVKDSVMLDTNEAGALDYSPGKNNRLRRYRDATGLNDPGSRFSPRMLIGKSVKVKIKHRIAENEAYEEVDSVAKA